MLVKLAADVYERYEHGLATRASLDFNDLITMAIRALNADATLAQTLRQRWPFILDDDAQDSSALQEQILRRLAGEGGGNWVRVGDPNQAIMSTFTAADPRYLRRFLEREDVADQEMAISGRCAPRIMELANFLVEWASVEHPIEEVRELSLIHI